MSNKIKDIDIKNHIHYFLDEHKKPHILLFG